jgi:hypothetical protein
MTTTTKKAARLKIKRAPKGAGQEQKPAKKLSQIAAAVEVLRDFGEPMTCKAMVKAMAERKLWASPGGKTPEATLYAAIAREIATKGNDARFRKASSGHFAARA